MNKTILSGNRIATATTEEVLMEKIRTRQTHVVIIGMGCLGLPSVVEFVKAGFQVPGIHPRSLGRKTSRRHLQFRGGRATRYDQHLSAHSLAQDQGPGHELTSSRRTRGRHAISRRHARNSAIDLSRRPKRRCAPHAHRPPMPPRSGPTSSLTANDVPAAVELEATLARVSPAGHQPTRSHKHPARARRT